MTYFMFQEKNGIQIYFEEQEKDHWRAYGEARDVDIY